MTDKDLHAGISELVNTAIELGVTLEEATAVLGTVLAKTQAAIIKEIGCLCRKSDVPD